jgi:hypothetical protein
MPASAAPTRLLAAVQAQDIAYVLGSLQTLVYDPVGNLRKADDQTTYGPATNSR